MTSPTYEEQANQFNELMEIARRSYDPLYREEVLHALLAMGTKFAESRAENARLTRLNEREREARHATEKVNRELSEQVRIYAEAVREWCVEADMEYGPEWVPMENDPPSWHTLVRLAASPPDGASALSENEWLRENGFKEREKAEAALSEVAKLRGDVAEALGWDKPEPWFSALIQLRTGQSAVEEAERIREQLDKAEQNLDFLGLGDAGSTSEGKGS